jgi:CheY-like chemotaxis protein
MTVDVGMKGIDGPAVIRSIRDDALIGPVKVVAVIPSMTKKKREELMAAGADEILDRPIKGPDLVAKVNALTGKGRTEAKN